MKKQISALAIAASLGLAVPGTALAQGDFNAARVVVIVKATTSQFWATVFDGADAAAKVLGVKLSKLGAQAETDVAGEVSVTENAIASKPTAIVIAATNAQALAQPIANATAAGIPVIVIDSNANTDKYVTFLATNNVTGGERAADEAAACVQAHTGKQEGNVAYMTALAGAQSLNDRDKGFVEQLKKYPGLKIVEHRVGNNDPARALSDAEDILTRHPDLVALFADNELEGDGAGRAIQEKSLGAKLCAVAFDTSDQEVAFVRNGNLDGLIVQNPFMMGYAGVWYGLAASKGVVFPKYVDFGRPCGDQGEHQQPGDGGAARPEEVPTHAVPRRLKEAPMRRAITLLRPAPPRERASAGRLRHNLPVETWVVLCTVLLWIALALASPFFLTTGNIFNIMRQVSVDAIIAYGELFTIITAGIDLSVGAVAGLTGVVFALMLSAGMNVLLAAFLVLVLGLVIGTVNGLGIDKLGIPAFIVTLAGLQGYRGLTMLVSGGMTVAGLPTSLGIVANTSVFGVPTMFVIMLIFALGSQYLLGATRLGRYMYALGSNIEAARRVGVNVTRVTLAAYGLAALFATIAGMLLVARLTMGNPNAGYGAELQAIAAAVVGGASLFGGRGTVAGCFIGAVLFTTIGNGANLLGVNSFWQMVIEGLLLAGVVYLDNVQKRRASGV